ncbi:MAG: D-glycero-beta-D-manno-heptose 1,7-bisphosphate 7-phosphatase, partial [Dehalococcoidales bacterium]|nr:D-glycero-beta-D-manno-heptose 1,7-bisphosphate 7-phosphatase [Dehalococcoidales bacterium]
MNKAIFVDRDGTVVRDVHYCRHPEDLEFLPSVVDGLRLLNRLDFKIIVITNQSGVARGYFTEETLGRIHDKMSSEIISAGGRIDAIYYCPHHPDDKCTCRKPEIGLLEQAAREWDIDMSQSYFIGDKFLDMGAANKAGCKAVLVPQEEPEIEELEGKNGFKGIIDFVCPDFITAVKWIEKDAVGGIKVSVLIPTLNEAENLKHVLP